MRDSLQVGGPEGAHLILCGGPEWTHTIEKIYHKITGFQNDNDSMFCWFYL